MPPGIPLALNAPVTSVSEPMDRAEPTSLPRRGSMSSARQQRHAYIVTVPPMASGISIALFLFAAVGGPLLSFLVLYWVIRLAVRHALRDAYERQGLAAPVAHGQLGQPGPEQADHG